jgi:hypothetical protein
MPVTAVHTALSAGRIRPSVPKVCVQPGCWYAFFEGVFQYHRHAGRVGQGFVVVVTAGATVVVVGMLSASFPSTV